MKALEKLSQSLQDGHKIVTGDNNADVMPAISEEYGLLYQDNESNVEPGRQRPKSLNFELLVNDADANMTDDEKMEGMPGKLSRLKAQSIDFGFLSKPDFDNNKDIDDSVFRS